MERMILEVVATTLFPVSDKPRAARSWGGGIQTKEKARLQRGQRQVRGNETLFCVSLYVQWK